MTMMRRPYHWIVEDDDATRKNGPAPRQSMLEGAISVRAALHAGSRDIEIIYIEETRDRRQNEAIVRAARRAGVPVAYVSRGLIEERATGSRHGGVIALTGPRRFVPLASLLPSGSTPFIAMIDGVEDPYNFGAATRSLYAAGADGLVVRPRNWMSAAAVVARSSAGASELMPTAISESAADAADFLEEHGLVVACATSENAVSIFDADLTVPLFLLIGGEQRGITRSFLRRATLRLRIPYGRLGAQPLGTAPAAAVLAFEIMRQRREGQEAFLRRPRTS